MPEQKRPDEEQQWDENQNRIKRDVDEGEDVRGGAGGGAKE